MVLSKLMLEILAIITNYASLDQVSEEIGHPITNRPGPGAMLKSAGLVETELWQEL